MACKPVCRLCDRLVISAAVTFTGGNLVVNLPAGSYRNGEKYCIVIGNEASGVDESIVAAADRLLAVPQEGMESLNAGVAAGVMMFALRYAAKPRKN